MDDSADARWGSASETEASMLDAMETELLAQEAEGPATVPTVPTVLAEAAASTSTDGVSQETGMPGVADDVDAAAGGKVRPDTMVTELLAQEAKGPATGPTVPTVPASSRIHMARARRPVCPVWRIMLTRLQGVS